MKLEVNRDMMNHILVNVDCPVCGKTMTSTANKNLFLCKMERSIYLPEFRESVEYYDCALEIRPEGGYVFQQYEMPPYRVKVRSAEHYPTQYGTFVDKLVLLKHDFQMEHMAPYKIWKELFHVSEELELPWHDPDKWVEKIKKLIIFS